MRTHRLLIIAVAAAVSAATVCARAQDNPRDLTRLVEALDIRPGMAVGEIGAGGGELTVLMAGRVGADGRVFSTEIDEGRLDEIRRAVSRASLGNVTVIAAGAGTTNLPEGCCDAIFMRNVYHHFENPAAINRSLFASLKPGGRLAVIDFAPRGGRDAATPAERDADSSHGVRAEIVASELEAAGFARVQVSPPDGGEGFLVVMRKPPDRVFVNARIWTGDEEQPAAQAMALGGERLIAVGSNAAIRALAGAGTEVVDLGGRRVVPGFNDAHWHLPSRRTAELAGAGSVGEIQSRLREFAISLPADAWVTGRGWTPADFPDNRADRRYLDEVFPDRPVLITDRDGHQALANTAALARAGVDARTPDPEDGRIDRDDNGAATGLLKESATRLVGRLVPAPDVDEVHRALLDEIDKAAAFGLTSLQIASGRTSGAVFEALQRALARGELKVRLRSAVPFSRDATAADLAAYVDLAERHRGTRLTFGVAKGMLDGTVDAHTAAMLEPYEGSTDRGIPMWTADDLARAVAAYDRAGLQIQLHAIGDRAIRMALDAFEHAARVNGTSGRRHRVEHVEVPALEDLPRFKALGVIASTQAMFASPDVTTLTNYAPALGPDRARRSNAFRLFDDAGAAQAFGSDYPVFTMDVLQGIHAAVTRELPDGTPRGGWHPEHRIGVEAALAHFTRGSAYASFEEEDKGTLTAGKLADFVVLTEDILDGPADRLLSAKVFMTVTGGTTVFTAAASR